MNVLIINYEYPPLGAGAASFTKMLAHGLANHDCNVHVFTSRYGAMERYEKRHRNLEIYRVPIHRKSLGECTVLGMLSFLFSGFLNIDKVIRHVSPKICLNFFAIPCGPIALYLKAKYGIPYVLCLRGGDVPGFSPRETGPYHRILAPLSRLIWRHADSIVANSSGLRDLAMKFYTPQPIRVIHNGVDSDFWKPMNLEEDNTKFRILSVGRLTRQKGLLQFFQQFIPRMLRVSFERKIEINIVGDGPEKEKLRQTFKQFNLENNVHFKGWIDRRRLLQEYNRNDLLVHPSFYEGMSNVIMEAKACGLPILGFNIAGNQELLEKERDIIICENDRSALAAELTHLLTTDKVIKQAPNHKFKEQFSVKVITNQFFELINDALFHMRTESHFPESAVANIS